MGPTFALSDPSDAGETRLGDGLGLCERARPARRPSIRVAAVALDAAELARVIAQLNVLMMAPCLHHRGIHALHQYALAMRHVRVVSHLP